MKIVTVLGARPQFIKAGVVSRAIRQGYDNSQLHEVIVHTGQHYDANLSDVFFEEFKIPTPDYKLKIGGKSHGLMTGTMLSEIEDILFQEKPDGVQVYGDTNSTLAGALAASKLNIPVFHVEAGLRSFNYEMPEEINRVLTDRVSKLLLCPTETAVKNLKAEGVENWGNNAQLHNVGDVMLDATLFYRDQMRKPKIKLNDQSFILGTIHRQENTDNLKKLLVIFEALSTISKEIPVVLPLHPRTKNKLAEHNIDTGNILIISPVSYFEMLWLLENSSFVMTDSGGLQKEAFFFKKPCLTLRSETEWVELLANKWNKLCEPTSVEKIIDSFNAMKSTVGLTETLYGSGHAGETIAQLYLKT